jgi:hypothetical protein
MRSLRSAPRRVRHAVRRQMRCGRCVSGCQDSTDRWVRTRRAASLRPCSRAREPKGRGACLAPAVHGRPRPARRVRQPCTVISDDDFRQQTVPRMCRRAWLRPPTTVGARRRTAKPERDRSRFHAATSRRAIRGVRISPDASGAEACVVEITLSRRGCKRSESMSAGSDSRRA